MLAGERKNKVGKKKANDLSKTLIKAVVGGVGDGWAPIILLLLYTHFTIS